MKQWREGGMTFHSVTAVCIEDVLEAFEDDKETKFDIITLLGDDDLQQIAHRMESDYLEQLFWSSLRENTLDYIALKKGQMKFIEESKKVEQ